MFRAASICCALAVLATAAGCDAADAGAGRPKVHLDRGSVLIEDSGEGWRVHAGIVNEGGRTASAELRLRVTGLNGRIYFQETESILARPGETPITVGFGKSLPEDALVDTVLRYRLSHRGEVDRGGFLVLDVLPQLETQVLLSSQLLAGTEGSMRVVTRAAGGGEPLAGADVQAVLLKDGESLTLGEGTTGEDGAAKVQFRVPDGVAGAAELRVTVAHPAYGEDSVSQSLKVTRMPKIMLVTDKPLYQPGQVIHMRALSLRMSDRSPAAKQPLTFEVMDSKGNKVFKKATQTDAYGVAFADFALASELNQGEYRVRALLGDRDAEKTVTVERYVLPKFEIELTTDRDFYQPGQTLKGEVQADYFFGKPVAGGEVRIVASDFKIRFQDFAELEGLLDENGHWSFEAELPGYFAGTPIEQGKASVRLQAVVVDDAEHREEKVVMRSVAGQGLVVHVVPEGGHLKPGLENRIYLLAAYPDGSPAAGAGIEVRGPQGRTHALAADAIGFAALDLELPPNATRYALEITAQDQQGRRFQKTEHLTVSGSTDSLLLRPEKVLYRVGDTLRADVFATKPEGMAYFDVVRAGQTMLTDMARLENGRASVAVDLDPALAGSIELSSFVFTPQGDVVSDVRRLYVDPADELKVDVALDAESYRPGETATFAFNVRDAQGAPTAAALGVSIVDESVFALQEIHPGLEKVYFALEQEIMKPRYEIHGYDLGDIVMKPQWDEQQQEAARVVYAATQRPPSPPQYKNTFAEKRAKLTRALQQSVQEDMQKIQQALQKLFQERRSLFSTDTLLDAALRKGYLRMRDIQDAWGNRYVFDFSKLDKDGGHFSIRSPGPDGIPDTADDTGTSAAATRAGGMLLSQQAISQQAIIQFETLGFVGERVAADNMPVAMMERETLMMDPNQAASDVRVREYFPETLLFEPALITDNDGSAELTVDMADSITTWRMSTTASSAIGALGSVDAPIRVFQPFFVDLDLPVSLTDGDQISIPVALYNYLDEAQEVRIAFEEGEWFALEGAAEQTVRLEPEEVAVRYFPITVKELGEHELTVYAYGSELNDAIRRKIEVRPNGERVEVGASGRISGNVTQQIQIPEDAVPGASKILVKVYPGVFTQVVDGLDSMLQMPFGCFEQTSSVTYPNILIVRYMEETQQINPELRMKAEGFINVGYQRLLSYEVDGGGFSWFGDAPANQVLTAWGLKEFHDMAQVHEVDPAVIERTRQWLLNKQQADGSWRPDEQYLHQESWGGIQQGSLLVTAYILEAVMTTGPLHARYGDAVQYIRDNWEDAKDPYTLGIVANALVAWDDEDPFTQEVLDTLHNLRVEEGHGVHWTSGQETVTFSHGNAADVEATALAAMAFLNSGMYTQSATKALTWLVEQKQPSGHWGATQSTILALKALLLALGNNTEKASAQIAVRINGEVASRLDITPENSDVMRLVDLGEYTRPGNNIVGLDFEGEGSLLYQVVGRYYVPWGAAPPEAEAVLSINVAYDKTQLAVDDLAKASVHVANRQAGAVKMVIVDLGIPPGFEALTADLDKLVGDGVIQKYEMTGRQAILYFEEIHGNTTTTIGFSYQLRAKYPLRAQTPETRAYEYYNPEVEAVAAPVQMHVAQ